MKLTSNKLRLLVILSLILIAVFIIVLFILRGNRQTLLIVPSLGDSTSLRSFTSPDDQGSTASTDPCSLLKRAEIEAEMGMSLGEPQSGYVENPLGERYCSFPDPEDSEKELFRVSIVFNDSIDPALLNDGYNVLRMFEGRKASPELIQVVNGVGDEAFWGGSGADLWNGLHVFVYDVYLQVDVNTGDEQLDYHVARNMAVAALERLFTP
jgi:hypothetical protein